MGTALPFDEDAHGRSAMLLELDSCEAWPADLELPSPHFVLFLSAARGSPQAPDRRPK
jgi:hypothetical protein